MPVLTVQIGQAALVGNQRRASSPWAHSFQDTSSDVDMGSLYLNLEGVSSETAGTIANEVARQYFENTSVTPETALLRSVRHAYRFLYDARLGGFACQHRPHRTGNVQGAGLPLRKSCRRNSIWSRKES